MVFFDVEKNVEFNQVLIDVIEQESERIVREVPYVNPEGRELWLSVTSSFLREADKIAGVIVLIQDITELRLSHEREKQTLEESNRLQRLQVSSLNKLALSVAHQIRNPMMSIAGLAGIALRKMKEPGKIEEYLDGVIKEAARLEEIVKAVTDYATISIRLVDDAFLPSIVDKAWERASGEVKDEDVHTTLDQEYEIAHLRADPDKLERALYELFRNSIDARNGTTLWVRVASRINGSRCEIDVEDDGKGIASDEIPFLFDPFFTTRTVGVGMGLSVVQRIITQHKGELTLASEADEGMTVTISLPVEESDNPVAG
jgi:signal transduction histidine kinase